MSGLEGQRLFCEKKKKDSLSGGVTVKWTEETEELSHSY